MSQLLVSVSTNLPTEASVTPPTPSGLVATSIPRGVTFTWNLTTFVRPYYWIYRTKVGTGAWSAATLHLGTPTLYPSVTRQLTAAEITSYTATATIYIEVEACDGATPTPHYSVSSASADASSLALNVGTSDVAVGGIVAAALATAVTDRMFSTSAKSGADLGAGTVTLAKLATDATDRMFPTTARTAVDTTLVNGVAAATVQGNAANGQLVYAKIPANVLAGTETITTNATLIVGIDGRFTATEKTKLEAALDIASLSTLAVGDHILVSGTHSNLVAQASAVKTDLSLNLVDNKSSTTIRGELTETNLQSAGGVTNGLLSNLTSSINGLSGTIVKGAMASVDCAKIQPTAVTTALFDASGNLTFGALGGVGIKSGSIVITPALAVLAIHTDGTSKNLDFTKPKAGQTLDDISQTGTCKTVTAHEKTGAASAYLGLNSSGQLIGSISDAGGSATSAEVRRGIALERNLYHRTKLDASGVTAFDSISYTGTGSAINIFRAHFVRQTSDSTIKIRFKILTKFDNSSTSRIVVYDEDDTVILASGVVSVDYATTGWKEITCAMPSIASLANDVGYTVRFYFTGTLGAAYTIEDSFQIRMETA